MKYEILNIGYGTIAELYEMYDAAIMGVALNKLKGFQRPWIVKQVLASLPMINGKKMLSIGEGLDSTAKFFSETYKADITVLDKYIKDDCLDNTRYLYGKTLEDLRRDNPSIKYIHGLAGFPEEHKIAASTFDCIYSNSVLEHVPQENLNDVLFDIDRMLKVNGIQIHTVDFPVDRDEERFLRFFKDSFSPFIISNQRNMLSDIRLEAIRTNPQTFYETCEIFKLYWFPNKDRKDVKYERWTSFNIALRKVS